MHKMQGFGQLNSKWIQCDKGCDYKIVEKKLYTNESDSTQHEKVDKLMARTTQELTNI